MVAPPSYSVPSAICSDGAHFCASPCVPSAYVTTGRAPVPLQVDFGTITVPVTTSGSPCWLVDWYITFHAFTAGSVTFRFTVAGRYEMSSPGLPLGGGEGGV